jgi:hypothetical protein
MTSWKIRLGWVLAALVVAGGCEVSTDDDTAFDQGGRGGTTTTANGGTGTAGSSIGGTAGLGGTGSSNGGSSGSSMTDAGSFPTPTCNAENGDDECLQCLKAQCCDEWRACDDQDCSDEFGGIRECLESIDFPESEDYIACSMENAADVDGMIVQENTNDLLLCIMESVNDADSGIASARCGEVCFGLPVLE